MAATLDQGKVVLKFADAEGALIAYNARDASAFEVCAAAVGSCRFVTAELTPDRNGIVLGNLVSAMQSVVPTFTRVRYCWADSPLCNLYDSAGLPVGPFEIAVDGASPGG